MLMKFKKAGNDMKRIYKLALTVIAVIMLVSILSTSVYAESADAAQSYEYELSADGQTERYANAGDIITVALYLNRTDANEDYTMYAMQNEISYDGNFFEYIEGSELLAGGVRTTEIAAEGSYREVYMNFLSLNGGEEWKARKLIGSFQLRVISDTGVSKITNKDYLVATQDGSGSYACEANEITVIVSTDCEVRFETNGGTGADNAVAVYGEKLARPEDPTRTGKTFVGWYKDIACTEPWDFDKDTVSGNITLYAKWADAPATEVDPPAADDPTPPTTDDPTPDTPPAADEPQEPEDNDWIVILIALISSLAIVSFGMVLFLLIVKKVGQNRKFY